MGEDIRILLIEPGEKPRLMTMEHTLENLQKAVGGSLQAVYPWPDARAALVCDDEGKFKHLPANRMLVGEDGEPYDIIAGTFFICGLSEDNFASLDDGLAERFTQLFYWPEMFMRTMDGKLMWVKMEPGMEPKIIG